MRDESNLTRICLTPTRNEAWIMPHFLAAAATWAHRIIVADQRSEDATPRLVQEHPRGELVRNDLLEYDEAYRQRLLLDRARQAAGPKVLLALDADEALSANALESREWHRIEEAKPGTVLRFPWVNILPDFQTAWIPSEPMACGFVDDGSPHAARQIHSVRIPTPPSAPVLDFKDIVVLHFQYVSWQRMRSKQRWYQAWETIQYPEKSALQIFRQYNHMFGSWNESEIHPVRPEWLERYQQAGIDYRTLKPEPVTWWDKEVISMLRQHGPARFRKTALWDVDWRVIAGALGISDNAFRDPRSVVEKFAHLALKRTQGNRERWTTVAFERALRLLGW